MITVLASGIAELDQRVRHLTVGELTSADQCVAAEDVEYAGRRKHPLDRSRCVAARAGLRLVAAHRIGTPLARARTVPIRRMCRRCAGAHGQPRLGGLSLSSSSAQGSVLAGAAAAGQDIGVDLELIPRELFSGFDAYALHPQETVQREMGSVTQRVERWVLKEAVLKAAGLGLEHPANELLVGDAVEKSTFHSHFGTQPLVWRPVLQAEEAAVIGLWCCVIPTEPGLAGAVAARAPQDIMQLGEVTCRS